MGEEVKRSLRREKENKEKDNIRGSLTFSSGLSTVAGVISHTSGVISQTSGVIPQTSGSSGTMSGGGAAKAGKEQQPHGVVHLMVSYERANEQVDRCCIWQVAHCPYHIIVDCMTWAE